MLQQARDYLFTRVRGRDSVLLALVWVLFYPHMATVRALNWWDESYYVVAAYYMSEHNHWIVPRLSAATPFFEKPPLGMWAQALSMEIFGPTLFAARVPSAVAALFTAILCYWIGTDLYNRQVGVASGIGLLALPQVYIPGYSGTTAELDMLFTLFGSLFVWLLYRYRGSMKGLVGASIVAAAAALTKGVGAGVFLFTVLPLVLLNVRDYHPKRVLVGGIAGFVVLLPWPVYAYLTYPTKFFDGILIRQLNRASGEFATVGTPLFPTSNFPYFKYLIMGFGNGDVADLVYLPVVLLVVSSLATSKLSGYYTREREGVLLWWAISVPLFFSLVGGNHAWYLLPMVVPMVVLAGKLLAEVAETCRQWSSWGYPTSKQFIAVVVLGALIALPTYGMMFSPPTSHPEEQVGLDSREGLGSDSEVVVVRETFDAVRVKVRMRTFGFYAQTEVTERHLENVIGDSGVKYLLLRVKHLERLEREYTVVSRSDGLVLVEFR